jgi:ubiquinol-cytochrome c reductase cytochrome b subunit
LSAVKTIQSVGDWLDERLAWRASWRAYIEHRRAAESPWSGVIGTLVATCFAVLVVTGVTLMTAYAPSPQAAWGSVHYTQYVLAGGRIVRGLHSWAAQSLLVLCALHVAQGAFARSYRKPREIAWWLTLVLIALVLGGLITGGLLPWDQRGWWARLVEGNIVGLAPMVGAWLRRTMIGGAELGALGLARAYAAHVVLVPLAMAAALWGRSRLVARHGWVEAGGGPASTQLERLARDAVVGAAAVAVLWVLAATESGVLLDAPADPTSDYPARPEWFLLSLFELRKFFHGPLEFWGTTLLPGAAGLYLALLPALDGGGRSRGAVLAPVVVIFAAAIGLGGYAWYKDEHDLQYVKQRAKAESRASAAVKLAMAGVPPGGALEMVHQDPELRGHDLFERHCASCHVLGDLGDPTKATASKLDGWGTPQWISAMMHDPDAPEFFGAGPYKGIMPSVDVRPKDKPPQEPWAPMLKNEAEKAAVSAFLASLGDEPGDSPRPLDEHTRALASKIVTARCTSCHLYKGEGDDEGSGTAPELWRYGSLSWTRAQIANPASAETYRQDALDPDRKKHMPRSDGDLSPGDIDVLARWTRAHARRLAR